MATGVRWYIAVLFVLFCYAVGPSFIERVRGALGQSEWERRIAALEARPFPLLDHKQMAQIISRSVREYVENSDCVILLGAFEADRRWIVVRDVSLTRKPDAPGEVQVGLVLATYFSGEESIPAPPPPASPARRTVRTVERAVER